MAWQRSRDELERTVVVPTVWTFRTPRVGNRGQGTLGLGKDHSLSFHLGRVSLVAVRHGNFSLRRDESHMICSHFHLLGVVEISRHLVVQLLQNSNDVPEQHRPTKKTATWSGHYPRPFPTSWRPSRGWKGRHSEENSSHTLVERSGRAQSIEVRRSLAVQSSLAHDSCDTLFALVLQLNQGVFSILDSSFCCSTQKLSTCFPSTVICHCHVLQQVDNAADRIHLVPHLHGVNSSEQHS